MARKRLRIVVWIVGLFAILIAACMGYLYVEGRPAQGRPQYVAMGSSFAAGPAITQAAENSPWFCARSRDNYAHQLARLRGLSLVDVSCGGATTHGILGRGLLMLPPQIDAVSAETELVTLTIGGNDIGYLANLMAMGCDAQTPWLLRKTGACRVRSPAEMEQELPALRERLLSSIDAIRARAPQARIVLVNYQTILPEHGSCARLGIDEQQATQMRGIAGKLAQVTAQAAQARGVLLMDAAALTREHDACAPEPWINGMHPAAGLLGAPLHPMLSGMTAVAQALNALLDQGAAAAP